MGLVLTSLESISREAVEGPYMKKVVEVYRDPAGNVVRFSLCIPHIAADGIKHHADVSILVNYKWEQLHKLLQAHSVENALARLFMVAAKILKWPEAQTEGSEIPAMSLAG